MNHMVIRPMTNADIPAVCAVWKKAGLVIADYGREQYELATLIAGNPNTCLVAVSGNTVVGTVIGAWNGRRAWIYHLAVIPAWQGKGVGSALLQKVETVLKKHHATKMILGVGWPNLKVLPFYFRQGYHPMPDMLILSKDFYGMKPRKGGDIV